MPNSYLELCLTCSRQMLFIFQSSSNLAQIHTDVRKVIEILSFRSGDCHILLLETMVFFNQAIGLVRVKLYSVRYLFSVTSNLSLAQVKNWTDCSQERCLHHVFWFACLCSRFVWQLIITKYYLSNSNVKLKYSFIIV